MSLKKLTDYIFDIFKVAVSITNYKEHCISFLDCPFLAFIKYKKLQNSWKMFMILKIVVKYIFDTFKLL